jgi:ATP-dependent RNA helicase DDX42
MLPYLDHRYDDDDNPILKKKQIEPLTALDHTKIEYEEFEKNFYDEPEDIAAMSENEVRSSLP